MGRFGSFVPRLVALTIVWLLATAALTFAAAKRVGTVHAPPTPTRSTQAAVAPAQGPPLVVPDVRRQPFVFAKGTLGDAGFAFRVKGSVKGYASNTVTTQVPAPGTRVIDTGAPTIVLHLARNGSQVGTPEDSSAITGTALRMADVAVKRAPVKKAVPVKNVVPAKKAVAVTKTALGTKAAPAKKAAAAKQGWPLHRPPAFVVKGAHSEPLDEMPLTLRAQALLTWVDAHLRPTNPNVSHWLFQHNWIVTGAQMGWWHGAEALKTLETVDQHVWKLWGIGALSAADARRALAEVEAKS
jgi:hypothetical protein